MGGKLGVNVFVLISGYYLIHNDRKIFDISKTVKFVGQVWFYSVAILIVSVICGLESMENIGIRSCIETLFPITFSQWWFASAYFVLYLIHPFLNVLLRGMDKALYQKLILLLVVCWSIIPTFTTSYYQSNSFLWFVTLYVIAGYLRLYGLNDRFTAKQYGVFPGLFGVVVRFQRCIYRPGKQMADFCLARYVFLWTGKDYDFADSRLSVHDLRDGENQIPQVDKCYCLRDVWRVPDPW